MSETNFALRKTSQTASGDIPQGKTETTQTHKEPIHSTTVPPQQNPSFSEADPQAELVYRHRLRVSALRTRRIQRCVMAALILLPVILATLYLMFVATPRYTAESRFSVRAHDQQSRSSLNNITSLISTGSNASGNLVDGWAVNSFINSRDAMHQLDKKIGLRRYLGNTTLDPVNRLMPDASDDALYAAYRSMLDMSYNMQEQINLMKINAFSPDDAQVVSLALLELAQQFVHDMDEKGIADALKVSQQAVTLAEQQTHQALEGLANWRINNGNIDPAADTAMHLSLLSQLEGELNTAYVNLYKLRALGNPDHPMMQAMKIQVAAVQKRLADTRQRLSALGDTEANRLKTYDGLKNAQLFAEANLATARQNYQQSYISTLGLQRYLSIIVHPEPGDRPSSPNAPLILLEAFVLGLLLALLYRIITGTYRALRYS